MVREWSWTRKTTVQGKKGQECKRTLLFLKIMITLIIKEKKGKENHEIRKIQQDT